MTDYVTINGPFSRMSVQLIDLIDDVNAGAVYIQREDSSDILMFHDYCTNDQSALCISLSKGTEYKIDMNTRVFRLALDINYRYVQED